MRTIGHNFNMPEKIDRAELARIIKIQRNEITEYKVYRRLARVVPHKADQEVLEKIADQEKNHYEIWKKVTGKSIRPSKIKGEAHYWISRILGINFGLRLMEQGERLAVEAYKRLKKTHPEVAKIIRDEQKHEEKILNMISDHKLQLIGSVVLGLNDALVELTGAIAGLTLALQDTRLIAIVGFITGIAASLSMAASEYLSTKEEGNRKKALRAGVVTGISYIITVLLLIIPYFIFKNPFIALAVTLAIAILIILVFTFYTSVARNLSFKKRFLEMAAISLGVAFLSFLIGLAINHFFGT